MAVANNGTDANRNRQLRSQNEAHLASAVDALGSSCACAGSISSVSCRASLLLRTCLRRDPAFRICGTLGSAKYCAFPEPRDADAADAALEHFRDNFRASLGGVLGGVTPGGVTPRGVTPRAARPFGVTPGGVTPGGVTRGGATSGRVTWFRVFPMLRILVRGGLVAMPTATLPLRSAGLVQGSSSERGTDGVFFFCKALPWVSLGSLLVVALVEGWGVDFPSDLYVLNGTSSSSSEDWACRLVPPPREALGWFFAS